MADIAPAPKFPERPSTTYERKENVTNPARRGPLRFEEGLATDTDVPSDFTKGMQQGWITPPGRPNHNMNVFEKPAEETMKERAHVGSAAWVDSPDLLGGFADGAFSDYAAPEYIQDLRNGARQQRVSPAVITD